MVKVKAGDDYILVDEELSPDEVDTIEKMENLEDTIEIDLSQVDNNE